MKGLFRYFGSGKRITHVVTISMASLIVVAVTVITILDVVRDRQIFESKLHDKGLAMSRTLNDVLANPLYFRNMEKLRQLADVARAQPEIVRLIIFAPDGRILVSPDLAKFPVGNVGADIIARLSQSADAQFEIKEEVAEVVAPVIVSGEVIGGVIFDFDTTEHSGEIRATVLQHVWQGALVVLVGIGLSYLLAQSIVRPVKELVAIMDRIAKGDHDFRIEGKRKDEIGDLSRALKTMAVRLQETERQRAAQQNARLHEVNENLQMEIGQRELAQQVSEEHRANLESALADLREAQRILVQQERLRAVGQMASGVAHDINNRLQVILGLSEGLMPKPGEPADIEALGRKTRMIQESVRDASSVIDLLRDYYRPETQFDSFEQIDLSNVVKRAISLTEPRWKDQALSGGVDIAIETELADLPSIEGSPSELREALINLIFNSVDAMPDGGTLTIRTYADGNDAVLEVKDTGFGMPEAVRSRCLEPFFTTKGEKGSGMGLAMLYRMVQRHDGTVAVSSVAGAGTSVQIRLPTRLRDGHVAVASSQDVAQKFLKILVVDDNTDILTTLSSMLELDDHAVTTATDGKAALDVFARQPFDLVILDRAMPGMNGDELAFNLHRISAETPVIMLTGFGNLMNANQENPVGVSITLSKPVGVDELRSAIAGLFAPQTPQRARGLRSTG